MDDLFINLAIEKIGKRVLDVANQKVIDNLENGSPNFNKVFARHAASNVLQNLLASISWIT